MTPEEKHEAMQRIKWLIAVVIVGGIILYLAAFVSGFLL